MSETCVDRINVCQSNLYIELMCVKEPAYIELMCVKQPIKGPINHVTIFARVINYEFQSSILSLKN